jgi:predicted nucleic acid-binding protein
MTARFLVDTNILVYAHDRSYPQKQERALELLDHLTQSGSMAVSVQSLAEFFWASTRRLKPPLTILDAARQMERFARSWPILDLTPLIALEATRGVKTHRLSYWDAQIWASARLNQIMNILSEDFSHNQIIEGVRFQNPLHPTFNLKRTR